MIGMLLNGRWPQRVLALPWGVILIVTFIAGCGATILYSAAGGNPMPWALPHAMRYLGFLLLALLLSQVSLRSWLGIAYPLYGAVLVALIAVEVLGVVSGGAQRWLDLGIIRLQPSEFMKLAIVLALARFYHFLPRGYAGKLAGIWPPAAMILIPMGLVLLQPDLGTTLLIFAGGVVMMFLGGLPLRYLLVPGAAGILSLPLLYSMLHEYQQRRVLTFLNPESDPLGAGYHVTQSKIAIGSGGIFGKGFLLGTQSHLDYLPEPQTDFIFSAMAEEWGLIGGIVVIFAFMLLFRWGIRTSRQTQTIFGRLTMAGLTMTIFFYVLINIMMVMGLAPVVGVPLPLVSHGGSAMLTVMLAFGIMMSIHRQRDVQKC